MERLTFSYTILVAFNVIFHQFVPCTAFPEVATVQQEIDFGSRFDSDESITNQGLSENTSDELKKCGIPNQTGLNKFGLEFLSSSHSKAGEFPWTVAILRKLNYSSGKKTLLYSGAGSLIHPSVVLTAANKHHTARVELIRAGEWDFGATNEEHPYQDRTIADIFNIDESDPDSVQLIFVTEPFVLSLNIRTVCLPLPGALSETAENRECTTAAWGQQNCSGLKGLHSILGRTELSTNTHRSVCEVDWQQYLEDKTFRLKSNQFCTRRKHSIDDSCFCDHGAALFCAVQPSDGGVKRYEQIGVSIATGGCTRDLPGIFSSVSEQRASIDRIFAEEGLNSSYYTA